MRLAKLTIAAAVSVCLAGAAWAETVKYSVTLEPDKEGGPGKGSATLSVDTAAKTLSGTIEYSGLAKPPTMAAFVAPPPKENGNPVTLPIPLPAKADSPITLNMKLGGAQIAGLKTGNWLLLLGTKQAPQIGGEIKPAQ